MLNLVSTLLSIIGYQSGYFWLLLFIANAVCRYKCNRLRMFLWLSLASIALFYVLTYSRISWGVNFLFIAQASICGLSFCYNIYRRNWNRDYLFFWIEPILGSTYVLYFFSATMMMQNIMTFFYIYLSLQAFVALWDLLGLKIKERGSRFAFAILPDSALDMMLENISSRFQEIKITMSSFELFKNDSKSRQKFIVRNEEYFDVQQKIEQERVTY